MDRIRINLDDSDVKRRAMNAVAKANGPCWFELSKARASRSLAQNAWLHGCVYPILREAIEEAWGERISADDVHTLCKSRFNPRDIINRETGEVIDTIPASTAKLTTTEFSAYVERIRAWAAEFLGVTIPDPDPCYGMTRDGAEAPPMKPQPDPDFVF